MPCGGQHPYNKPESVIRLNTEYASIQLCYPEDMNQCVAALLLQDYFLSFVGSRNWQRVKKLGTISSFLSHFFPYLVIKQQYSGSFSCSRAGGWSYLVICLRACVCFAHVPKAGLSPSLICHYNTWQKGQKILRGFTGYFNIRFTVESYIRSHKTTWPTHVLKQTVEENGEGGGEWHYSVFKKADSNALEIFPLLTEYHMLEIMPSVSECSRQDWDTEATRTKSQFVQRAAQKTLVPKEREAPTWREQAVMHVHLCLQTLLWCCSGIVSLVLVCERGTN